MCAKRSSKISSKLIKYLLVVAVLLGILILFKDAIIENIVLNFIRGITGLEATVEKSNFDLLHQKFYLEKVAIMNPSGFSDETMININRIYFTTALQDLLKGELHVKRLFVDIESFFLVKNRKGQVNIGAIDVIPKLGSKGVLDINHKERVKRSRLEVSMDTLEFRIGRVRYIDYTAVPSPLMTMYSLNFRDSIENVNGVNSIVKLLIGKAVSKTGLSRLLNVNIQRIRKDIVDNNCEIIGE